ncbi:hypothetical protein RFI_38962 [Reticulomyxa filosa]|uniref:Uncharacterized protein n=1 Tax=Reticulomyxa filosa TaxID=46433 RepID=X6LAY9_RETFI|nr:hypothetical protein RFI_38962 [Reticulomyxa filosa]|eukprot:ETN98530.1 hypothetical protein RFI_38962 [Reticulomyxa filosa]
MDRRYCRESKTSTTLQIAIHSPSVKQSEEKKVDEVTFENVWKKNMKVRRQFMCSNVPTIVFIGLKNKNILSRKVLAHTFRTLFVHFAVDVNEQQLANNFNDSKNGQIEQKENSDDKQRIVKQPRCDIYRKTFATEQKQKRENAVKLINMWCFNSRK